jgi:serine/threonine-protein kinase
MRAHNESGGPACPDHGTLSDYSQGRLPPDRIDAVAMHVSRCPRCASELLALPPDNDSLVVSLRRWVARPDLAAGATPPSVQTPDRPRARIGKYELIERLAGGGMGVVHKARDVGLGRVVALKTVRCGPFAGPEALARFRAECQAVARLEHPNIVRLYEAGEWDGEPYFSMEFVPAGTLAARLVAGPRRPAGAAALVETLARAVQFAHDRRVVHRDLKPANVLLTDDDVPKITDFGLAKLLDTDAGLTHSEAVLGTAAYMAPEQARGEPGAAGPAADVYGLGAILYECLTGRPPFKAASRSETLAQVCSREPEWPSRLRPRVPQELEAVCLRCLAKDPGRRYRSAGALAEDLARWRRGEPTMARPAGWAARVRRFGRRHRRLVAAALLGPVVAGGVWYADPDRPARQVESAAAEAAGPLELIGASGGPRWHHWRVGGGKAQTSLAPDGAFAVHSWDHSLLELLRDPGHDRYRVRAQVRHESSDDFGEVGLYVCHAERARGAETVHSFLQLTFNDVRAVDDESRLLPPGVSAPRAPGNPVNLLGRLYVRGGPRARFDERLRSIRPAHFRPAGFGGGGWRALTVEVTPERVRGFWEGGVSAGTIQVGGTAAAAEDVLARHGLAGPGPRPGPPLFPACGSLGLFVLKGSASFRAVTIEPLAEPDEPLDGGTSR